MEKLISLSPTNSKTSYERLTVREREVYRLLLDTKLSIKEIAASIGISEPTIGNHCGSIYAKFGVHNRVELMNAIEDPKGIFLERRILELECRFTDACAEIESANAQIKRLETRIDQFKKLLSAI